MSGADLREVSAQRMPLQDVPLPHPRFQWSVDGLCDGTRGGEASARASFLCRDGSVWTTYKDGIILTLLAPESMAVADKTPSQHYAQFTDRFGTLARRRLGAPLGNGGTANAWFAAPPSDTDGVHKDYREFFLGSQGHLRQAQTAARSVVLAEPGD